MTSLGRSAVALGVALLVCAAPAHAQPAFDASLKPGLMVRVAMADGRVVCRAMVHYADSSGLRLIDGTLSPPPTPWRDLQWLWVERHAVAPRVRVPWGIVGLAVAVGGTVALANAGRRTESFAPLGLLVLYPIVWGLGGILWAFGPNPPPGATTDFVEWQPVLLPVRASPVTRTEGDVHRECPL